MGRGENSGERQVELRVIGGVRNGNARVYVMDGSRTRLCRQMEEHGGGANAENKQTGLFGGSGGSHGGQEVMVVHKATNSE